MPSRLAVPGVRDFLRAFEGAIAGDEGSKLRARRGGSLDLAGGSAAVLWAREAARDRGLFRRIYLESSDGEDLERLVERHYDVERVQAEYGAGKLTLQRPTAAAGSDTIDTGTRIEVLGLGAAPAVYTVASDTTVGAAALIVEIPIRATRTGRGVACSATSGIRLADSIYDATFVPIGLTCADGTDLEPPATYLARARQRQRDRRVGYVKSVEDACKAAGAENVVILDPGIYGPELDNGITWIYVADTSFTTTEALIDACYVAIDDARVAGCDAQVLGMTPTPVELTVSLVLWDDLSRFDRADLTRAAVAVLLDGFGKRTSWWLFDNDGLAAEVFRVARGAAQVVTVLSTPTAPDPGFPDSLPRYTLKPQDITVQFVSPGDA